LGSCAGVVRGECTVWERVRTYQMSLPYMSFMADVAKTPRIAVTVTVRGAPMSWLRTGARRVLANRVQSDCLVQLASSFDRRGKEIHYVPDTSASPRSGNRTDSL
jgi:hypothetical protein